MQVSFLRIFFILVIIISLFFNDSINSLSLEGEITQGSQELIDDYESETVDDEDSSLTQSRSVSRFLAQKKPKAQLLKCNKFPKRCHGRGSPGPHCCKKKCVNVLKDRNNCGYCGKKCKYGEICCNGKCVNPSFNRKHCGGCNNRCKHGDFCAFGLCNYA